MIKDQGSIKRFDSHNFSRGVFISETATEVIISNKTLYILVIEKETVFLIN